MKFSPFHMLKSMLGITSLNVGAFYAEFGMQHPDVVDVPWLAVDWGKVAGAGWDGIHVSEDAAEIGRNTPGGMLHGFDCESTALWNPKALEWMDVFHIGNAHDPEEKLFRSVREIVPEFLWRNTYRLLSQST